jgi:predicted RNase H-like HicB family nuclease
VKERPVEMNGRCSPREEVKANMREAIEFHIEGLRIEGLPVPEPTSQSAYVDVAA